MNLHSGELFQYRPGDDEESFRVLINQSFLVYYRTLIHFSGDRIRNIGSPFDFMSRDFYN